MSKLNERPMALQVKHLSKSYRIYDSPGQRFASLFFKKQAEGRHFDALRDVSFDVEKGTSLGLLGRNGAGKSTLMQLIAGTLTPSTGTVHTNGRISPLLELGSGFNPEYTGLENIRLNAAILGFSRDEVAAREADIAEFADIGEFIERPIKTYSSGMFARLAFSVAIHVEPEILLVDEILSVGDMTFQQKCVNKLRKMREEGLTLVFVSHSPDAVKSVCDKAIFLDRGMMRYYGPADLAVDQYLAFMRDESNREALADQAEHPWKRPVPRDASLNASLRYGSGHVQIVSAQMLSEGREPIATFKFGEIAILEVQISAKVDVQDLNVNFLFRDGTGIDLFGTSTFDEKVRIAPMKAGAEQKIYFCFPIMVRPGSYGAAVSVTRVARSDYSDTFLFDQAEGIAAFSVIGDPTRPVHYKFHVQTRIEF